ncbi:MAG: hypothetical protein LBK04_02985 [Clostridiales Family XIII bacterium]|jgi:hypothetical protein|nr:hypothetical protein [Clostridiales Family XIII bacterium]
MRNAIGQHPVIEATDEVRIRNMFFKTCGAGLGEHRDRGKKWYTKAKV